MTDAPERIWIDAWGGNWSPVSGGTQEIEYVRADRIEALIDAPDVTELVGAAKALMARWPTDQHSASPLYEEAQRLRAAVAKLKGEKG
jgi:hypothetical protein